MKSHTFNSKRSILQQLSAEQFISGNQLGERLGISRAAVAKHIKELNQWGLDIFTVKGRGYRLAKPLQMLDEALIRSALPADKRVVPIQLFPVIDSTNRYWMERYQSLPPTGSCCLAEMQTAGRGRRGRAWQSPFAAALYLSTYWFSEQSIAEMMGLSLAVGVGIARWLRGLGIDQVTVKWPNDIYIQGAKVAGILIELAGESDGHCHLVVGVGLNLDLPAAAGAEIEQAFTDLYQHLPASVEPDRNQLAAGLINSVSQVLQDYHSQGMAPVVAVWPEFDHFLNQPVQLLMGKHIQHGIVRGINPQGGLLVESEQGMKTYYGGEISVRAEKQREPI